MAIKRFQVTHMKWKLLVLLGAMSFGILSTIVKLAYAQGFMVNQVVMSQLWLGALICWLLTFLFKGTALLRKFQPRSWGQIIWSGIPLGFTSFAYYKCVSLVPASFAIILLFQFVWMGLVIDAVFQGSKPSKAQYLSVGVLILGTILASGFTDFSALHTDGWGIIYGLLAALSYTLFIYVSRTTNQTHFLLTAALRATGGALFASIIFPPTVALAQLFTNGLLPYAIPLAVFGMVLPPIFYAWGVPKIGTTSASIISGAELPVAVLSATLILHEPVHPWQWIGVLLILFAIALPSLKK